MNSGSELPIRKPVSIWHRPIEVKFGALARALGRGVIAGAFGNWEGLAGSGVDTLDALGLKTNDVEAIAWLLVQRSLLQAMSDLTKEYRKALNQEPDFKMLCEQLDRALEIGELALNSSFFDRPKDLPVIEAIKAPYQHWLQCYGLSAAEADAVADRLPRYFVFALNEQW